MALTQATASLVIDCRDPGASDSPTGLWSADGGLGHTTALTERIGWRHWALDHGHRVPRADGTWYVEHAHSPGTLVGLHARDSTG